MSILTVENLIENLIADEVQIEDRKNDEETKNKKVLAFNTTSDKEDSDDDDEKISMFVRKFRKFIKRGNFKSKSSISNNPLCFKCNKPGHMKKDCPILKNKQKSSYFNNFNNIQNNKKRKQWQSLGMIAMNHLQMKKLKKRKVLTCVL